MSLSTIPSTDDTKFAAEITPGSGLVAVEFGAEWCGPCHMMAPALEAVARELEGRVKFLQVDADTNPRTTAEYGVRGLPTLLVFRDGEVVDRMIGAQSIATLRARLGAL